MSLKEAAFVYKYKNEGERENIELGRTTTPFPRVIQKMLYVIQIMSNVIQKCHM